jgi:hypothetical protein
MPLYWVEPADYKEKKSPEKFLNIQIRRSSNGFHPAPKKAGSG